MSADVRRVAWLYETAREAAQGVGYDPQASGPANRGRRFSAATVAVDQQASGEELVEVLATLEETLGPGRPHLPNVAGRLADELDRVATEIEEANVARAESEAEAELGRRREQALEDTRRF